MSTNRKGNYIVIVRRFKIFDLPSIKHIIKSLHPEWFTEEALENIPRDILFARCYVAERNNKILGFISVHSHDGKPMLGWLGIEKKLRGKGIGRLLLEQVERDLIKFGYKDLRVETVGECVPKYEPYTETLSFYLSHGFRLEKKGRLRNDMGYKWRYSTLKKVLDRK